MKPCVLALGFFDGVHLGHGGLLTKARQQADALGLPAAALTFDRHPASYISGCPTPLLNTVGERTALMRELYQIDCIHVLRFNEMLCNMPWESFAKELLLTEKEIREIIDSLK